MPRVLELHFQLGDPCAVVVEQIKGIYPHQTKLSSPVSGCTIELGPDEEWVVMESYEEVLAMLKKEDAAS